MSAPAGATIFALSSGPPPAAIAVVRISGPAAGEALVRLAGVQPPERRPVLRSLRDEAGGLLDRALVLWLPGPHTATGEDMAELHLHGGRATVAAVLRALAGLPGLVPAEPGAFTRRALEHGRLDLAAVEGLADLLAAETEVQRRGALRLADGALGRLAERWRAALLDLSARVEAVIEFAEEHDDVAPDPGVAADLAALAAELATALAAPPAERLRDGVRVVVAGPPNVGKSSLVNALAGREVAIALPEAGTTRDLIEAPVVFDGLPLVLVDSAGLREAEGLAERIGVERATGAIEKADLVLWLGAPAKAPAGQVLVVQAMSDQPGRGQLGAGADLLVSAHTGAGMSALRGILAERIAGLLPAVDSVALYERHRVILGATLGMLRAAAMDDDELLVAEQLRSARRELDRLTGAAGTEDMLDGLFSRFCVGK